MLTEIKPPPKIEEILTDFEDGSIPFAHTTALREDNLYLFWDALNRVFNAKAIIAQDTTASLLLSTDSGKKITSVADLTAWIAGTAKQVIVTDDTDGSVTLSTPQDIDTDADVEFDSIILDDLTALRLTSTNGSKKLVSIANLTAWIAGTTKQITVTDDTDGSVTLSTPQNIDTDADVEFDSITLGDLTALRLTTTDGNKKLISIADGTEDEILTTNGSGTYAFKTPTSHTQLSFSMYDAEPKRSSETSLDGAFIPLATAQPLNSSPTDIIVSKGTGKLVVVVNAGSDFDGEITVTGTSVDRNTGAATGSDTDVLTIDALTTDNSDTDTNGNDRHALIGAYITSKWFTGTVTLSTTDLTLTDVDVYHVSFEQFDDTADLFLDTFDANILTTNVNAEFDAYLYSIMVTGDKCNIAREASLNVGSGGETALVDRYWRLRRGNINKELNGETDGTWIDVHYSNSPAYVEDVSIKVWATEIVPLTLS